ncbi:biopolymer transporter ExbD [Oxalobacter aliiformigenes]|uniref:Biopolymer transporter ExbD n=1 Tax=Oxalobacter aliiformigenes TaxID=2946593 RepID=A0A9E9LDH8_9BURK|nr:biopolymer transporter ExbD [Oxalobacter aliiformigenes]WAV90739.1 biopolymer transporter ExbD [Oxalobacter aliiformigenes]
MAFGGFENKHGRTPMAEMNMVPLIDVMLVLLVIFIVTAPLLSHSVRIELPQASSKSIETTPAKIDLAIQSDGELLYNGNAVDRNTAQALLMEAARKKPMPEVHIYADRHADYQYIAQTLSDASRAGLTTIGFITRPQEKQTISP